jgi:hypothetical protein
MKLVFVLSMFVAGCDTSAAEDETCAAMCQELVETCEFAAYPSYESCMQGCAYARKEGGDMERESACILKAECDEFAVIDCEHAYGPGGTELAGKK